MRLNEADHYILAAVVPADAFAQHAVGLPNAGCIAQKKLEDAFCLLGRRRFLEPIFRFLCEVFGHGPPSCSAGEAAALE
jgi:hypothetical protein